MTSRTASRGARVLVVALLATVGLGILGAGVAFGYWLTSSSNTAQALADTLPQGATPNQPVTTPNPNSSTVQITFSQENTTTGNVPITNYSLNRYSSPGGSETADVGSCGAPSGGSVTCTESGVPDGNWVYTDTPTNGTNWKGVESAQSPAVFVDATPPTNHLTLSGQSGGSSYLSGTNVYYHGSTAGSFTITNALTDSGSGPASSTFPTLSGTSTGWTHTSSTVSTPTGGPYVSNTFSWNTSTASSPTEVITGTDNLGNTATTTLTFVNDTTAPSGGSVSYTNGYNTTGSTSVAFTNGTDSGSGINTATQLERASATLTGGTCGSFGSFSAIGSAGQSSPYSDTTLVSGNCYKYEYVVSDNVGNTATYTSASVVKVDTSGPTLTIGSSGNNVYYPGTGTTVYFKSGGSGSFTITAADTTSGISSTNFPVAPTGWTRSPGTDSATYTLSSATSSSSLTGVSATNGAGTVTSENVTITLDTTAPSGGSVSYTNGYNTTGSTSVAFTNGTDSGSGINTATQLERASATLTGGTCGSFGSFSAIGSAGQSSPYSDTTLVSGNCYEYEYVVSDNVGNTATYTSASVVKVDTGAPTLSENSSGANVYYPGTGSTIYYRATGSPSGSFTLTLTDTASGIGSETFPTISGWTKGSVTTTSTTAAVTYTITSSASAGTESVSATNGAGTAASGLSFTLTSDTTAPSGGSVSYTNGYNTTGSTSVAFTNGTDSGSGINTATQLERASATLTGGTCGSFGSFSAIGSAGQSSPYSDTTLVSGNCYEYEYVVSDNVGNTATYTSASVVKVDTGAPTLSENSSGANVYYPGTGSTIYYRATGSPSGSFTLTLTDTASGIGSETFPTISGWTKGSVTTTSTTAAVTYTITSSASAGTESVSATNGAGTAASGLSFTLTSDTTAPSGGSVSYTNGYNTTGSTSVAFTNGTDSGSGINTATQLERASATLTGGTCGSFGSFSAIGSAGQSSPYSDTTLVSGNCYKYEYVVSDNVGNTATYTSASVVKVDTSGPTLTIGSSGNNVYYPGTGTTVYFKSGGSGSFTITAADTTSGISSTNFPVAPTGWTRSPGTDSATYTLSSATSSSSLTGVSATNGAGTATSENVTITLDTTAPSGGSVSYTNGYNTTGSTSVAFTNGTDSGSGINTATQLERASATLTGGTCGSFGSFSAIGSAGQSSPYSDTTLVSGNCYEYEYVVSDNVGNTATYTSASVVKVDTGAPTLSENSSGANVYYPGTGSTIYYRATGSPSGSFTLTLTDTASGIGSETFPTISGWTKGSVTTTSTTAAVTYTITSSASAGTESVSATNGAGTAASGLSFTLTSDTTAPSGGSVSYTNGYNTTGSTSVAFTNGTDSGSGINTATQLERASATLTGGTCGSFGSFSAIGSAGQSSPYSDTTLVSGNCYEYEYVVSDNVGNTATYTSASVVKVDTGAPTLSENSSGANVYYPGTGSTIYYRATGSPSGSFTLTLTDTASGIGSETFPTISGWTKGSVTTTSTTAAVTYTITSSASAGTESVSATNGAGTAASGLSFTLTSDATAPVNSLSLTSQSGGGSFYNSSTNTVYYQGSTAGSFTITNTLTDTGSGPASSTFPTLSGTSTGWTHAANTDTTLPYVSNAFSWTGGTTSGPTEVVTGTDNVGNTTTTTLNFVDDTSTLTQTTPTESGGFKYKFAGTNTPTSDTNTVTIYYCTPEVTPCTSSAADGSVTATPAGGSWTSGSTGNLGFNTDYSSTAYETDSDGIMLQSNTEDFSTGF